MPNKNIYLIIISLGLIFTLCISCPTSSSSQSSTSLYFGNQINLSNNRDLSVFPQIAAYGNNTYVVWQDNSTGNNDVYFAYSNDEGSNFKSTRNLSNNSGDSEFPQIAAYGNNTYVVWQDNSTGNNDVYFAYSNDEGSNFKSTRNLSNNSGDSEFPQIAAYGNNTYVVWQDNSTGNYDILFKPSGSNGKGFKSVRQISNNSGDSEFPQIAAYGNNTYVVWQDNSTGNYDILFKPSGSNGKGFKSPRNLSNNSGDSEFPQIAAYGNNTYVVWQDNSTGNYDILFSGSESNGKEFKNLRQISNNPGQSEFPQIVAYDNKSYVVWNDVSENETKILYKRGNLDKYRYGSEHELLTNGNVQSSNLVSDGKFSYVVWDVHISNKSFINFYPLGFIEDYSGDGIVISGIDDFASNPRIDVASENVYVIWQTKQGEGSDIFFKKISLQYFGRD